MEHNVSLRCILGLSILLTFGVAINLVSGELFCTEINRKFLLTLYPSGKGLLDGTTLNKYSPFSPPGNFTNITSTTSLLQYTFVDGVLNPLSKGTPSNNIVVKDSFYKHSISRELCYIRPEPK